QDGSRWVVVDQPSDGAPCTIQLEGTNSFMTPPGASTRSLCLSPDGNYLALSNITGPPFLVDLSFGRVFLASEDRLRRNDTLQVLGFSSDSRRLFAHAPPTSVCAFSVENGRYLGALCLFEGEPALRSPRGFYGTLEEANDTP